jgi:hypothetical protein
MLDLDASKLATEITEHLRIINQNIKTLEEKTATVNVDERRLLEEDNRKRHLRIELLYEYITIANGIPDIIVKLRKKIMDTKALLSCKDISTNDYKKFEQQVKRDIGVLRDTCKHPFVIGYTGQSDPNLFNQKTAFSGYRVCIICGLSDYSILFGNNESFRILHKKMSRLVQVIPCSRDEQIEFDKFNAWQPPEPIIKEVFVDKRIYNFLRAMCSSKKSR